MLLLKHIHLLLNPFWLSMMNTVSAIWPLPLQYTNGSQVLWLSPDFHTVYKPVSSMQTWEKLQKYLLFVAGVRDEL